MSTPKQLKIEINIEQLVDKIEINISNNSSQASSLPQKEKVSQALRNGLSDFPADFEQNPPKTNKKTTNSLISELAESNIRECHICEKPIESYSGKCRAHLIEQFFRPSKLSHIEFLDQWISRPFAPTGE